MMPMLLPASTIPAVLLLAQAPGSAIVPPDAPLREVRRIYWELVETMEVRVRLAPEPVAGGPPLVNLLFQAFFPGRARLEPYSLRPDLPTGTPARLAVRAEPFPLTAIRALSLRFVMGGYPFDLTGPGGRFSLLPCGPGSDDCAPNAVEADLDPALLRALASAETVTAEALGFPIRLSAADQRALADFAARVGLAR